MRKEQEQEQQQEISTATSFFRMGKIASADQLTDEQLTRAMENEWFARTIGDDPRVKQRLADLLPRSVDMSCGFK